MARPKASTSKAVASEKEQAPSSQSVVAKTAKTSTAAKSNGKLANDEEDDETVSSGTTKQRNSRAKTNGNSKVASTSDNNMKEEEEEDVKPTRKRKAKASCSEDLTDLEDLEKNDEETTTKKSKGKGKAKAPRKPRKYKGLALEPFTYPERHLGSKKFIGVHVSIAESVAYAPHRALVLGGKAFGLFLKNQKTWAGKPLDEEAIRLFKLRCTGQTETIPNPEGNSSTIEHGDGKGFDPMKHLVPHGSYLTNLCNPDKDKRQKSYDNFLDELERAEALGIGLFNFHPGSTVGGCTREQAESYAHIAECINKAHGETKSVVVLLENMAGKNNIIGYQFEDLAAIIALVDNKSRIGVCFDTCHAFAAGYDLRTPEAYAATFQTFDEIVGLNYLKAFHANDSKADFESHRDLHENIGAGKLGLGAFHIFMRDPRFDDIPFILETPMLSGSLSVTIKKPRTSTSTTNGSSPVKSEVKVETKDVELLDEEKADNDTPEGNLTIGASTWKREIQLLHALEKVPVGETSEEIETLQAEIMALVMQYRKKEEAAAELKKKAKEAAKAEKAEQDGNTGKKSKSRKKAKIEPKEEDEEEDEGCASHGEHDD